MKALLHLRVASLVEGMSWLVLLFIAMPLKYFADMPFAVRVVGSVHGALFVILCLLLLRAWIVLRWPFARPVVCFIAALVPFGAFWLERSLKREQVERAASAQGA